MGRIHSIKIKATDVLKQVNPAYKKRVKPSKIDDLSTKRFNPMSVVGDLQLASHRSFKPMKKDDLDDLLREIGFTDGDLVQNKKEKEASPTSGPKVRAEGDLDELLRELGLTDEDLAKSKKEVEASLTSEPKVGAEDDLDELLRDLGLTDKDLAQSKKEVEAPPTSRPALTSDDDIERKSQAFFDEASKYEGNRLTIDQIRQVVRESLPLHEKSEKESMNVDVEGHKFIVKAGKKAQELKIVYLASQLGSGGFGTVYSGRKLHKTENLAYKVAKPGEDEGIELINDLNAGQIIIERLASKRGITEQQAKHELPVGLLKPPHKINVLSLPSEGKTRVVKFPEMKGDLFENLLGDLLLRGDVLPVEIMKSFLELTEALSVLSELDITHNDLKPENILMKLEEDHEGNTKLVLRISDLGLLEDITHQSDGLSGSPNYIPIDDIQKIVDKGESHEDVFKIRKKTDVFGLASAITASILRALPYPLIKYENEHEFADPSKMDIPMLLSLTNDYYFPADFVQLIIRALAPDSQSRISAQAFHQGLKEIVSRY